MWSAMRFPLSGTARSAEAAGDVVLGLLLVGVHEDPRLRSELDQLTEIHEGGVLRDARRLLHVVRHDDDGELGAQLLDQLLDLAGRDRIERRGRLVEEDDLGALSDGAGDAEALLLPAGQ